jgi:elongation factor G
MKTYETASIRNVAVCGHGGSGKTSLVSAMLFDAGAVNRLGKVEEGNTVTDFDADEIARQISLSTALAHCEWNKTKLNLLDTPGYGNFIQEARVAIHVADTALVNVCGVSGVEV